MSHEVVAVVLLCLYLIQLLVPAAVLLDLAWSWYDGYFSTKGALGVSVIAAAAGATIWLAAGLAGLFRRDRRALLQRTSGVILSIYTTVFVLLAGEVVASALHARAQSRRTFLRPPGSTIVRIADPRTTPGTSGRKLFTVNDVGLRGRSVPPAPRVYRIITVGGSTTECYFLDDSEEWPHALMLALNQGQEAFAVAVANAGFSGHTTVHTRTLIESVPILRKAEMLILMVGINDLQATLEVGGAATEEALEGAAKRFLDGAQPRESASPPPHTPALLRSNLYRRARALARRIMGRPSEAGLEEEGDPTLAEKWYGALRQKRATANPIPLPDLKVGLAEYRSRIATLGQQCRNLGLRCLFLTQPTLWRSDLTAGELRLTWFGWVGARGRAKGYVSVSELAHAMDRYNQALLETCRTEGLECFDLAAGVPKDTSALFDDCHFNAAGARLIARRLADYLLSRAPFPRASSSSLDQGGSRPLSRAMGSWEN